MIVVVSAFWREGLGWEDPSGETGEKGCLYVYMRCVVCDEEGSDVEFDGVSMVV
jgi:hypothetical protein